jgi:regulator of replication initiation timing
LDQIIVIDMKSISENEVLSAIDSLENRIENLIKEKDQMYLENQSLKDENSELIEDYKEMKQKNSLAKNKAEMILDRLNEIENSA